MSFATLALITSLGLIGPLVATRVDWHLPVILGELFAGMLFGATGFRVLNADEPTFAFLADVAFSVVMFVAGTHVPVRDPAIRKALGIGALRAAGIGVMAAFAAYGLARAFGIGHAPLYAVLIASSSAALVLPIVDSLSLQGRSVLALLAQVAVADTAASLALPLVIDPANALRAGLGAVVVALVAACAYVGLRHVTRSGVRRRVHRLSQQRGFALELRISLLILFTLAALAKATHVSVMLAGFLLGLAVSGIGEPRRVARQLFALNDGFLAPLFFIWLGARIDLREFGSHPKLILLGLALGGTAILVHVVMRLFGQPVTLGALAASQIGVPAAAVTVGSHLHVLKPGEPAALILGALVTIGVATYAASVQARREPAQDH